MMRVLILLLLANSAWATSPLKEENKTLSLVWSAPFFLDTAGTEFLIPTIVGNNVIFCSRFEPSKGVPGVVLYEQKEGKELWRWQKNITTNSLFNIDYISDYIVCEKNMTLYVTNDRVLYALDILSPNKIEKYHYPDSLHGGIRLGLIDDKVLHYSLDGTLAKKQGTISIYQPLPTSISLPLISMNAFNGYEFTFGTPTSTTDAKGDTLLLFLTRAWNFNESKPRVGLYAYDIAKQKMKWEHPFFDEIRDGTTVKPVVCKNEIAVFQLNGKIVAIDIENGTQRWEYMANSSSTMTQVVIHGDTLFFRCDQGYVSAIEPISGELLWKTEQRYPPATLCNIEYYNNMLYFTGYAKNGIKLYALSAKRGDYQWSSYGHTGRINGGIVVNPKTGHLFCSSNTTVMCIDLKEE